MSKLKDIVAQEWADAIEQSKEVLLPELAKGIISRHEDAIKEDTRRMVFNAVVKELKSIAKNTTDESGQMELFGFPSVIAIPHDNGFVYLRATAATYEKLVAGCTIRQQNVDRAQTKLDTFKAALAKVEPLMSGTDKTLQDVIKGAEA